MEGPGDFERLVPATTTLEGLPPGDYTVVAAHVSTLTALYVPGAASQTIPVVAGATRSATISYALSSGSIALSLAGLPGDAVAQVVVTGQGTSRVVSNAGLIAALLPGTYALRADSVSAASGDRYAAAVLEQQVTIVPSETPVPVSVTYAIASGSLALSVVGLSGGPSDAVTITGPGGYRSTTSSTGTIRGLRAGTYAIAARPIVACPNHFAPALTEQSVDVSIGQVTNAAVEYGVHVPSPETLNLSIASVQIAQAVQNAASTLPIVAGRPALVRVFGIANQCSNATPAVRLRLSSGDSIEIAAPEPSMRLSPSPGVLTTSWNALLPGTVVQPGLTITAEIDPTGSVPEADEGDNRFPATGQGSANVVAVPPLRVTFIPVTSAGVTGNVTPDNTGEYLVATRQLLPLGEISVSVAPTFTSQVNFGSGTASAYQGILQEIELKRRTDSAASPYDGHYYGVVRPVPGITFVSYGGWAYIGGKSAVGMQVGWFNNQRQATELVAHELSHNFGRQHAPCGAAAGPDPQYPYVNGVIGQIGYDVWSAASLAQIVVRPPQTPDIMGYCSGPWISDYNYGHILAARAPVVVAAASSAAPAGPSVVVTGMISPDSLRLDPVFQLAARPSLPAPGDGLVSGYASDGGLLFRVPVRGEQTDHGAPEVRYFTAVLPLGEAAAGRLARVELSAGGARVSRESVGTVAKLRLPGAGADDGGFVVTRGAAGVLDVTWNAREWQRVLIRDGASGSLLAVGRDGAARIVSPLSTLELIASDGTRTATFHARVR